MYSRDPIGGRRLTFGGQGLGRGGKPPRDLAVILAVVFVTFTLQFFDGTAVIPALLRLTPDIWRRGFLWQVATYAFTGLGGPNFWFLLELLILFWFGRDVHLALGQRKFRKLLAVSILGAAGVAILANIILGTAGIPLGPSFVLMQGQRILWIIFIAAFATINGNAVIYLFFVLPIQARWFILMEIVLGFLGFLSTKDVSGFLGICSAVGISWAYLTPGGPQRRLKEWRLRGKKRRVQRELQKLKEERGMRIVRDDEEDPGGPPGGGPWIN